MFDIARTKRFLSAAATVSLSAGSLIITEALTSEAEAAWGIPRPMIEVQTPRHRPGYTGSAELSRRENDTYGPSVAQICIGSPTPLHMLLYTNAYGDNLLAEDEYCGGNLGVFLELDNAADYELGARVESGPPLGIGGRWQYHRLSADGEYFAKIRPQSDVRGADEAYGVTTLKVETRVPGTTIFGNGKQAIISGMSVITPSFFFEGTANHVYVSTREAGTSNDWQLAAIDLDDLMNGSMVTLDTSHFTDINGSFDVRSPFVVSDGAGGHTLYFASKESTIGDPTTDYDIWSSQWNSSNGRWDPPAQLAGPINGPTDEIDPCVDDSVVPNRMYFSRAGVREVCRGVICSPEAVFDLYVSEDGVDYTGGTSTVPGAPTGLVANEAEGYVSLSWSSVADAQLYFVYREENFVSSYGPGTTKTREIRAVTDATSYVDPLFNQVKRDYITADVEYWVTAVTDGGESSLSAPVVHSWTDPALSPVTLSCVTTTVDLADLSGQTAQVDLTYCANPNQVYRIGKAPLSAERFASRTINTSGLLHNPLPCPCLLIGHQAQSVTDHDVLLNGEYVYRLQRKTPATHLSNGSILSRSGPNHETRIRVRVPADVFPPSGGDAVVDADDLAEFNFAYSTGDVVHHPLCDLDGDGVIDSVDQGLFTSWYNAYVGGACVP